MVTAQVSRVVPGRRKGVSHQVPVDDVPGRGEVRSNVDGPWTASVEAADHPDELALDPDVVVVHRLVLGVRRLEADPALFLEDALERDGVLLDLGHDDVAVPRGGLWPDHDEVSVRDVRLDHRISPDSQD